MPGTMLLRPWFLFPCLYLLISGCLTFGLQDLVLSGCANHFLLGPEAFLLAKTIVKPTFRLMMVS